MLKVVNLYKKIYMKNVVWRPSPNFEERQHKLNYIILHGTWMADDEAALTRLCDETAKVSCHYFITQTGEALQLVEDKFTSWHAGISHWKGVNNLNHHSIGIEISNPGVGEGVPYHACQYKTLIKLLQHLLPLHNIPPQNVLGHDDIAPGRKDDPGTHFNWQILVKEGLAIRP